MQVRGVVTHALNLFPQYRSPPWIIHSRKAIFRVPSDWWICMNLHAYKAHTQTRKCDKLCPNGSEAKRDSYLHQQQQQGLAVFLVFSSFLYISYSCLCCCRSLGCSLCYCCCWPGHGLSWRRCCCRCCCRCFCCSCCCCRWFLDWPHRNRETVSWLQRPFLLAQHRQSLQNPGL